MMTWTAPVVSELDPFESLLAHQRAFYAEWRAGYQTQSGSIPRATP